MYERTIEKGEKGLRGKGREMKRGKREIEGKNKS